MSQILLFNKPFGVLSQFTSSDNSPTLAASIKLAGFYPAGRLDKDSEGLLLLTDDGKLQQIIANPAHSHGKTYYAQVEGEIDEIAINRLQQGILLNDGPTRPADAQRIPAPDLWERVPPIRQRKNIPTSWLELTLYEGRNRQVRRMTAEVGYPTLRLVRMRIAEWEIGDLQPGASRIVTVSDF